VAQTNAVVSVVGGCATAAGTYVFDSETDMEFDECEHYWYWVKNEPGAEEWKLTLGWWGYQGCWYTAGIEQIGVGVLFEGQADPGDVICATDTKLLHAAIQIDGLEGTACEGVAATITLG
jgi:hypothetical protein